MMLVDIAGTCYINVAPNNYPPRVLTQHMCMTTPNFGQQIIITEGCICISCTGAHLLLHMLWKSWAA